MSEEGLFIEKMSTLSVNICPECNKELSTKYTLIAHLRAVHKIGDDMEDHEEFAEWKCRSPKCKFISKHKRDYKRHMMTCSFVALDSELANERAEYQQTVASIRSEYECRLAQISQELAKALAQKEILQGELQQSQKLVSNLINRSGRVDADDTKIQQPITEKLENMPIHAVVHFTSPLRPLIIDETVISTRRPDHYVNVEELSCVIGTTFEKWIQSPTSQELLSYLSDASGISSHLLVDPTDPMWIHHDLAIAMAYSFSVLAGTQVSRWVRYHLADTTLDVSLVKQLQKRVNDLESICLSKRRRTKYEGQFFVYLLTNDDHLKRRVYIIGKTKNMENRLGTYNKTCDHSVVHYRECGSEANMDMIENLVMFQLNEYREQANRDRVILPEDKEIDYFKSIIDECVQCVNKADNSQSV
jgi:hypothetical protein